MSVDKLSTPFLANADWLDRALTEDTAILERCWRAVNMAKQLYRIKHTKQLERTGRKLS